MAYIYVASPYTHDDLDVMHERFLMAERYCANALRAQHWVYSPIIHCHEMAKRHTLPTDHKFWEQYNFAMLGTAMLLEVLCLPGWMDSKGVDGEVKFAEAWKIPIIHIKADHRWLRAEPLTRPGLSCPHCGDRHPPDGMCTS